MAAPYSLQNATIDIYDDTVTTRLNATLVAEDGDLNLTWPNPTHHRMHRGTPGRLIKAPHVDPTGRFSIQVLSFTGAEDPIQIFGGTATSWAYTINDLVTAPFTGKAADLQDAATDVKLWQARVAMASPTGGATQNLYLINCVTDTLDYSEGGEGNTLVVNFSMPGATLEDFLNNID